MIIEMTGVTNSSAFQKLEDESNVLSSDHRNLNGIYTDGLGLLRKKSLGEIFYEMLLRKKSIIGFRRMLNGIIFW